MVLLLNNGNPVTFLSILQFDHWLFARINRQWTNAFFDHVLPYLRESEIWVPFYLFLLVFVTINFGKKGWWWSFALIMTAIISDLISSSLVKQFIFRYRPCRDPFIADQVRLLVIYCPRSSSFVSSHACNHFAAAVFIYITLKNTSNWWKLVFLWAFSISYAQIYVGVHYPLDVTCGIILGCFIGYMMSIFFRKQFGSLTLK
ncbi:MAG TPA: phosphatase PAP2 family protein [Puia sp.]|nr:phosphatase PAP2 family protein [Puia sp.]